jgi:hypothetical protein
METELRTHSEEERVPEWSPMRQAKDRPTDTCCIPIFFVAILMAIILAIFNITKTSNAIRDYSPIDSKGNRCGEDASVKDFPYLLLVKFSEPLHSVCAKTCPRFDYNQIEFNADGKTPEKATSPEYYESLGVVSTYSDSLLDQLDEEKVFGFDPAVAKEKYTEEQYKQYLARFQLACSPNEDSPQCKQDATRHNYIYDTIPSTSSRVCLPVTPRVRRAAPMLETKEVRPVYGQWNSRVAVLASIFTALLICLAFTAMVSCCMVCTMWISIVVVSIFSFFASWILFISWLQANNEVVNWGIKFLKYMGETPAAVAEWVKSKLGLMFLLSLFLFCLAISLPVLAIFRVKHTKNSSLLLQTAQVSLSRNRNNLYITFASYFAVLVTIALAYWGYDTIYSAGEVIKDDPHRSPFHRHHITQMRRFQLIVFFVIAIWAILSIFNIADWISTTTAVGDYFNTGKDAFKHALSRVSLHWGSIIFGGAVFLLLDIVRMIIHPFHLLFKTFNLPRIRKVLCHMDWYERYVLRVSEHAYAMQALVGVDVVPSAKLFSLLENKHYAKYPYSNGLIISFCALGVFVVSLFNYLFVKKLFGLRPEGLSNDGSALFTIILLSALLAICFMRVFYCSVYGSLGAFYAEVDRDGGTQHPIMAQLAPRTNSKEKEPLLL